jgi:ligand-binding sensor domain-containing protein
MLHSKHISVFISFVLAIFNSAAQLKTDVSDTDKFRAVHWGLDEGLSHGEVYSMIKDINGFLWIATPFGLNRFDGSSFKKYIADKTKKNKTIIGNDIMGFKRR